MLQDAAADTEGFVCKGLEEVQEAVLFFKFITRHGTTVHEKIHISTFIPETQCTFIETQFVQNTEAPNAVSQSLVQISSVPQSLVHTIFSTFYPNPSKKIRLLSALTLKHITKN